MEESTDGENVDEGSAALELLQKKAEEVFNTFELLPSHLQMDGLDILQGIVTRTVRKITMGKVASVKFVPVQQKKKDTIAVPPVTEQSSDPPELVAEVKQEFQAGEEEDEHMHTDYVHTTDGYSSNREVEECQRNLDQPPDLGEPSTPREKINDNGPVISKVHSLENSQQQEQPDTTSSPRSSERQAARTAAMRIKEEILYDEYMQFPYDSASDKVDCTEDTPSDELVLDLSVSEESDEEERKEKGGIFKTRSDRRASKDSTLLKCRYCAYTCKDRASLHNHKVNIHSGNCLYECEFCRKKFSATSSLKRHKLTHTGEKQHECPICGKRFYQESQLKVHTVVHTGERLYQCTKCSKCYTNSANLRRHYRIHTGEMPYRCTECDAHFRDFSSLKLHKLKHTGEKPYTCGVCQKQFKTSSDYRRHERTHTGERKYKCPDCGKMFIQGWHLVQHSRIHQNERAWPCDKCGKRFRTKASLQYHTRSHEGIKNYTCPTCKKSFSTKKYLQSHQVVHTLAKPYRCSICGKRFNQYPNMKRHERVHSEEKRYTCKDCGKKFKYINSLQYHESIHRGEKVMCTKCGLGFRSKNTLQTHRCDPSLYHENLLKTVAKQKLVVRLEPLDPKLLNTESLKDNGNKLNIPDAETKSSFPRIVLKIPKEKLKRKTLNVLNMTTLQDEGGGKRHLAKNPAKKKKKKRESENKEAGYQGIVDGNDCSTGSVPAVGIHKKGGVRNTGIKKHKAQPKKAKPNIEIEKRVPPLKISTSSGSPEAKPVPIQLFSKGDICGKQTMTSEPPLFHCSGSDSNHSGLPSLEGIDASESTGGSSSGVANLTTVKNFDEFVVKLEVDDNMLDIDDAFGLMSPLSQEKLSSQGNDGTTSPKST